MDRKKKNISLDIEEIGKNLCKIRSLVHILISCIYMEIENEVDSMDILSLSNIILNEMTKLNEEIENMTRII